MSANEKKEPSGSGLFSAFQPDEAQRFIANPKEFPDSRASNFFIENARLVGQLYELIQKFLTSSQKSGSFYPELSILETELQLYKRSINDKAPMPSESKMKQLLLQMSLTNPPVIHIVREMVPEKNGSLPEFKTFYVAPTEKHPDKISVAYQSALRNSVVAFKTAWIEEADFPVPYVADDSSSSIHMRAGRLESLMSSIMLPSDWAGKTSDFPVDTYIRKFNEGLRIRIFRPLILDLLREKLVVNFSCDDLRKQTNAKIPDIVLVNQSKYLYKRFHAIKEIILSNRLLSALPDGEKEEIERLKSQSREQPAVSLAANGLIAVHNRSELPMPVLDLAAESIRLTEYFTRQSESHAKEQKQRELTSVLKKIQSHHGLFRAKHGKKFIIPEKYLELFLSGQVSAILIAADPPVTDGLNVQDYDNIYLAIKDRESNARAIDSAISLFRKVEDPALIRILEELYNIDTTPESELKKFIPPVHLNQLKDAIQDSYLEHVPALKRLWMNLTGKQLSEKDLQSIRSEIKYERLKEAENRKKSKKRQGQKKAKKDIRKRAREIDEQLNEGVEIQRVEKTNQLEDTMQDILGEIIELADAVWDRSAFPDRDQLLSLLPKEKREEASKVLGFVDAGAASASSMIRIPVTGKGYVYASKNYINQNKDHLVEKFERKLESDRTGSSSGLVSRANWNPEMDVIRSLHQYLSRLQ